jgi:hypothetical protein
VTDLESEFNHRRELALKNWVAKLGQRLKMITLGGWTVLVLLTAVFQRVILWIQYRPISYGDSPSYWRLANAIREGWNAYDGTRTPGYPLVLVALGSDELVYLTQLAMGVAVTALLFGMAWLTSQRAWFAGFVGLAHTLNLPQLFFEANILSETATSFWLALSLGIIFLWVYQPEQRTPWLALVLGISTSLAWLTRPLFVFLPAWLAIFLLWSGLDRRKNLSLARHFALTAVFLLPVALTLAGWVSFIHSRFGDWSLTTMTGYHLVQHTGHFFEYVPDKHAAIRDTYIEYRDRQIARHGNQTNTIWEAIPEMQEVSGASFYELSRVLSRISIQLILEHPQLYLANVLKGWWYFWRVPIYWSPESIQWSWIGQVLKPLALLERLTLFAINLAFLASSLAVLAVTRLRKFLHISPALWCLAGTVWAASVAQTLIDHGDNPRFLVPLQSFVVLWVFWIIWRMLHQFIKTGTKAWTG